jgi:hypothetical protein
MTGQDALVCARCQPAEQRIAELEQALQSLSDENDQLGQELAGARRTVRTLERQITKLSTDLDRAHETDPRSVEIKVILEYWKLKTGHKRAKTPLTGERAKLVKGKLRTYKAGELMEAIDGLALLPYVRDGKRVAYGHPSERYDDIDHALGTEKRIETHRRKFKEARQVAENGDPAVLWERHDHYAAMAHNYMQLMIQAKCREQVAAGDETVVANVVRLKEIQSDVDAIALDRERVAA